MSQQKQGILNKIGNYFKPILLYLESQNLRQEPLHQTIQKPKPKIKGLIQKNKRHSSDQVSQIKKRKKQLQINQEEQHNNYFAKQIHKKMDLLQEKLHQIDSFKKFDKKQKRIAKECKQRLQKVKQMLHKPISGKNNADNIQQQMQQIELQLALLQTNTLYQQKDDDKLEDQEQQVMFKNKNNIQNKNVGKNKEKRKNKQWMKRQKQQKKEQINQQLIQQLLQQVRQQVREKPVHSIQEQLATKVAQLQKRRQQLQKQKQQSENAKMCVICFDSVKSMMFRPCGHVVCCKECAPTIKDCPLCRTKIKNRFPVYI